MCADFKVECQRRGIKLFVLPPTPSVAAHGVGYNTGMAKQIGNELPEDAFELLRPGDLGPKRNKTVQIVTVDSSGWPHAGLLSYADIIAKDRHGLCLATWADGECAQDLRHDGRITLLVIDRDMAYYVRGMAREAEAGAELTDLNEEGDQSPLAFFEVRVKEVYEDRVPTARVLSGVTFGGSEIEERAHGAILAKLLEMAQERR